HRRHRAGAYRAGGDGLRGHYRLPGVRGLQLPHAGRVLQGGGAGRDEQDAAGRAVRRLAGGRHGEEKGTGMLYAFGFERVSVLVSDLYFIDPAPLEGQETAERGVRLELRMRERGELKGSIYSAQPIGIGEPVWRGGLPGMGGRPPPRP